MLITRRPQRKVSKPEDEHPAPIDADEPGRLGASPFRFAHPRIPQLWRRAQERGRRPDPMRRLLDMVDTTPLRPYVAAFVDTNAPPVPIDKSAVDAEIAAIDAHLRAGGTLSKEAGQHLNFAGRDVADTTAFHNLDLRFAAFRGSVLKGQQFGISNVADADFRDADLTDADLSQVTGLLPEQLSGADLTRCKLPADIATFDALENIGTLSENAGKIFVTAILSCIFGLLTTFTTRDIQLLTNSGTAELPVLSVAVSTRLFFGIAPLVLLLLSVGVHLYLQRLWETMAMLPAVFPDGQTADNKTYPWLVNDLIRIGFPILSRDKYRSALSWIQLRAFAIIAYWGVPATLVAVFFRCLSRHDDPLSLWQALITALSFAWACAMIWLHRTTLERADIDQRALIRYGVGVWARPTLTFLGVFAIGWVLIIDSCAGTPLLLTKAQRIQTFRWTRERPTRDAAARIDDTAQMLDSLMSHSPRTILARTKSLTTQERATLTDASKSLGDIPLLFDLDTRYAAWKNSSISHYALSTQLLTAPEFVPAPFNSGSIVEDITQLSDGWKPGPDTDYPNPPLPRAVVRTGDDVDVNTSTKSALKSEDYYVPGASAPAYDHEAREWHDRLTAAVKRSSFQGTNLRFLKAHGAFLVSADFRGAVMTGADFSDHADLRNAIFDASKSAGALLDFASFQYTKLDGAGLAYSNLTGADLSHATMIGVDLTNAVLSGANLRGTNLIGAGLSAAHLRGAGLANANLITANLTGADLIGVDLTGAHLIGANASHADLSATTLVGAKLQGAKLTGATLIGANGSKSATDATDLTDVDLAQSNLTGATFTKAILSGAKLDDADLTKTDLTKAHLDGASLVGAKLTATDLTAADLTEADLTNAYYPAQAAPHWPGGKLPPGWILHHVPTNDPRASGRTDLMELIPTDQ